MTPRSVRTRAYQHDAADISKALAVHVRTLVDVLLPAGHREGHEWRCGSIADEPGSSLGVHLIGAKAGVWSDFAAGISGDALNLVGACLGLNTAEALKWSRQWLGIDTGQPVIPRRPAPPAPKTFEPELDSDRWRPVWNAARPIAGTAAENYLRSRGLRFEDPDGRVLRFTPRRVRRSLDDSAFEHHPALLCALCDVHTGAQRGIQSIFLDPDGRDRLRDKKGKTTTGHFTGAAIMLSEFEEPTLGLVVCEGAETGIFLFQEEMRPVWACGPAGNLKAFPILGGIETLTIAHDNDLPGLDAAEALAQRWRDLDREVLFLAPPFGKDWADRA